MPAEPEKTLTQEIEERRRDPEFMARLCEHMAEDKAVLDRLGDSRLTSLQAGLKAEVERLREQASLRFASAAANDQHSRGMFMAGLSQADSEAAERLENLLRESEGKGADQ